MLDLCTSMSGGEVQVSIHRQQRFEDKTEKAGLSHRTLVLVRSQMPHCRHVLMYIVA